MDRFTGRESPRDLLYLVSDRTTAYGWMNKSKFRDACPAHFIGSRKLVKILVRAKSRLASGWIPGDTNKVVISVSLGISISPTPISQLFFASTFICSFPQLRNQSTSGRISSWLISLLQKLPAPRRSPNRPIRSQLRLGSVGNPTSSRSTSTAFSFSREDRWDALVAFCSALRDFKTGDFSLASAKEWYNSRSKTTTALWHRPFGFTDASTQEPTNRETLRSFYNQIKQIEHPRLCSTCPTVAIVGVPPVKRALREFMFLRFTPGNSPESSKKEIPLQGLFNIRLVN
jgi:hypothetical protein